MPSSCQSKSDAAARTACFASALVCLLAASAPGQTQFKTEASFSFGGWSNAGPAMFALSNYVSTNFIILGRRGPGTNVGAAQARPLSVRRGTNASFQRFIPESLSHLVWTNFLAHTNRETPMFAFADRKVRPPVFAWNTNCWVWGRRGLTGCSPMSKAETWKGNAPGQIAITALTRRHGYTRGHAMGGENSQCLVGVKVWFVTASNTVVERAITAQQTRFSGEPLRDYTLVIFNTDLPASIEPLRVAGTNYWGRYPWLPGTPHPMAMTEQGKTVQAGQVPFDASCTKGGDSGSPVMLPLPDELVLVGGITTSPPDRAMQEDMDALSRRAGLNPEKYQMKQLDLTRWPAYP